MMPRRRVGLGAVLALVVLAAMGCGTAQRRSDFVWPGPPDKPRIRYVRSIATAGDLRSSGWERFRRIFVGANSKSALFNPTALALSPDGRRLYVSLTASSRVLEVDFSSGKIRDVANGSDHRAKHPYGLATDATGNLYVADQGEKVVLVYSSGNAFVREIGRTKLERPTGIAVDSRRQLVYVTEGGRVDDKRHQIEVFAFDGRHLRTIGSRGSEPGQFNFPTFLAVSRDGMLYVADTLNFRIQIFDPDGNLAGFFGTNGDGVGGFNKMKGLAFDPAGLLYVADSGNSFVQIFNRTNQLLLPFGGLGGEAALMRTPTGIAIDPANNIFVADLVGNRVNQYVLVDSTGADGAQPAAPKAASPSPARPTPPPQR